MGKLRQTHTAPHPQARVEREKKIVSPFLMIRSSPLLHSIRPGPGNGDTISNEDRQFLSDKSIGKSDAENLSWKLSSWVVWSCVRLTKTNDYWGETYIFSPKQALL